MCELGRIQSTWISQFQVPPKTVSRVCYKLVSTSRHGAFISSCCTCSSRAYVLAHMPVHGDLHLPICSSKFLDSATLQVQLKSIKTALAVPFVQGRGPALSAATSIRAGGIEYRGRDPD